MFSPKSMTKLEALTVINKVVLVNLKGYYWSWRNGVNKIPLLLHFPPIAKGGTKTIAHLPITEGLSFPSLYMRI